VSGTLFGLGLGPGDPELVTPKARLILRRVAVVAYPAPETGPSFARSIVTSLLSPVLTEIAIRVPMVPERAPAQAIYDAGAVEIARHLDRGADVAVLCQGDPFFYGSFIQIFERLAPHYQTVVVPGVSSLMACAAAAHAPLAVRDEPLLVLPAPLDESELERRVAAAENVAIIKLGRHFAKVLRVLRRLRRADQAIYVERASLATERVLALDEVDAAAVPYFSLVLLRGGAEPRS
jgi:precorrin-2/cobalt-factor-2 C20-methyltransferase